CLSRPPRERCPVSEYPVHVADDSLVMNCLQYWELPGRDPLLPPIYIYVGSYHREHPFKITGRQTYVYIVDDSPAGKSLYDRISKSRNVPSGFTKDLMGFLQLRPGDALLARPISGNGLTEHDVVQSLCSIELVCFRTIPLEEYSRFPHLTRGITLDYMRELAKQADASRLVLLGSREEREKTGKTAYERTGRAVPVGGSQRCYGASNMVQKPRQVAGPPAAFKMTGQEPDEGQEMIRQAIQACSKFNALSWRMQCPQHLYEALQNYADQLNTPRFGCPENIFWHSMQLNHANTQDVAHEQSMTNVMGQFGGKHIDAGDANASHTAILVLSDIGEEEKHESGRLHMLGPGAYFQLDLLLQGFFSGLLVHGGTSPLVSEPSQIVKWATRMVL
ncbi:hypothetical protein BDW22DRAFT_1349558, partial [Trametopsis cervina]